MVTVAEAADRFMTVLLERAQQFRPSPPPKTMLRQIFLDWCTQIPIPQIREYILADFSTHLEAIYQVTLQRDELAKQQTTPPVLSKLEQFLQPTPESAPYMSFSPQPSTYIDFLQDLLGYLTPNEANGELFWEVLNALLSPTPVTFSIQDSLILQEVRFNVLFELLVRYLPTLKLTSPGVMKRLEGYPQVIVPQILTYFSSLPYITNHTHSSTLAKALTSLCLLIQPTTAAAAAAGEANKPCSMLWLETMISSFKQMNLFFDVSFLLIDLLTLWSHFLLVPSLFSQSMNWSMNNAYQGNLQDQRYTLLGESDYDMFQDVTLFSPVILSRLAPYMNHLTQMLSPQSTTYPTLFTTPRLIGGMVFVFSMFQHVGTVLRFYNTVEFQQFTDLATLKLNLIRLAKTLQLTTVSCEGVMLPLDLQRTAIQVVQLVQKATRNRAMRQYRRTKKALLLKQQQVGGTIKKEKDVTKKHKKQQNDSDDEDDGELILPTAPLLQLAAVPVVATVKDFLSNPVLKEPLYSTTSIPFSRGQELNVLYLHKAKGAVSSVDDFSSSLLTFVGGKAKDLRAQRKRDAMEQKRKALALQKKQKHLLHQAMRLKKKIYNPQQNLTEEEKSKLNDDIINDESLTDEERIILIAKRFEEQDGIEKAQLKRKMQQKRVKQQQQAIRSEIAEGKSTPLTSLLSQLVIEAKGDYESDNDEDKGSGDENGDGQDGLGVSFEDEAYGGLTDSLLGAFKSRLNEAKQNDSDNSDDDDDDDNGDSDSDDAEGNVAHLVNDELFSFKANTADFDDFGDIEIQ